MANNLRCTDCKGFYAINDVTFIHEGTVPGTGGMKRHVAVCRPCRDKRDLPKQHWQDK